MTIPLTWLYVPGDRETMLPKAAASTADCLIIDWEDAVAPAHKATARALTTKFLSQHSGPVQVRINAVGTPWHGDDVECLAQMNPNIQVRVPKVQTSSDALALAKRLPGRSLHLLLETALGVENAYAIASSSAAVKSIGLGEADLRSEIGLTSEHSIEWIRLRVVVASRAAGLGAPAMSVYPQLNDTAGLIRTTQEGKTQGFRGRAAIHPAQLQPIRESFRPDAAEVEKAHATLKEIERAQAVGIGASTLSDGSFVDIAMAAAAQEILALAAATNK